MYKVVNIRKDRVEYVAKNQQDLISYLSRFNVEADAYRKEGVVYSDRLLCSMNYMLARIAMVDSDMRISYEDAVSRAVYKHYCTGMYYRVFDEYDRMVDPRIWVQEVWNTSPVPDAYRSSRVVGVFRRDPVSHLCKGGSSRGYARSPKRMNVLRAEADPEMAVFARGKRRSDPLVRIWDAVPRGKQRSWKENSRKAHQWM